MAKKKKKKKKPVVEEVKGKERPKDKKVKEEVKPREQKIREEVRPIEIEPAQPTTLNEKLFVLAVALVASGLMWLGIVKMVGYSPYAVLKGDERGYFAINKGENDTFSISVDGKPDQTINLTPGQSQNAAQIASDINSQSTGVKASSSRGRLKLATESWGTDTSLKIGNGTSNSTLGFYRGMEDKGTYSSFYYFIAFFVWCILFFEYFGFSLFRRGKQAEKK
ncbi:MAG: hypothetical protein JSU92_14110 [Deltaproteobacteria bacterium]|nr:MAG: hypothetical protein JSU92_14110 [Deltaproteobacteria bacterium]